ncbi:hypothetical protein [Aliikangiella coralliicola]|uniref:Uncharacterized protein n=1 Tax=Aliikangiella coralliicola TaxID=2592383 RepID=A0A545UB54_9GAMM|nr:hypothetical protein [Aliikangiella coralliicola]TQV86706.1 hypothetical protein FLL46_17595 [Aliikangiella coralliicola]
MSNEEKHADLLYDYIKFHLGLYISTPPVLAIIATALHVEEIEIFQLSMVALIIVYFIAGVHASRMITDYINVDWKGENKWAAFSLRANCRVRRFFQHYLYWVGLLIGLAGILFAKIQGSY